MIENNVEQNNIYESNKNIFVILIIPVAILAKMIEHLFLPENYFYDSTRINMMVIDPEWKYGWYTGTYKTATDFFRKINIFDFTTLTQWSITLGIIMTIVVIIMLCRCKGVNLAQTIMGCMCVALLNIYIFNISKDVLQFGMFFLIYIVISMQSLPIILRAFAAAALLYWESNVYRSYYIIMAFFFVIIYIVFSFLRKKKKQLNWKTWVFIVLGLFVMVFVFLYAASILMPEEYSDVLGARNYSNDQGQNTAIKEVFVHGNNLGLFMANYVIDSFRMMCPVELLPSSSYYAPFFIFQIFMDIYVIRAVRRMKYMGDTQFIALCIFIAYFMGSVLFEPDFGSFLRHESATFPIIVLFVFDSVMWYKVGQLQEEESIERKL